MVKKGNSTSIALFERQEVRRVWHREQWWFVVADVVQALIDTRNVRDYIKKMRLRDAELSKGWGQIVTPLWVVTVGGRQKLNCASLEGIFRIIQSVPSPKAEPFKRWLATVGKERVEEIQNPELAMERMKLLYEKKGYPKDWIDKRTRGIAVRQSLTDEWRQRGAVRNQEYAILTNEIMHGTFGMDVETYKSFKGIERENLRDHMVDIELILTMLAEATTTKLTQERDSFGFDPLRVDARDGGDVAGRTRKDIEQRTGKPVATKENYKQLESRKRKKKLL